jgi:hypothetical protein
MGGGEAMNLDRVMTLALLVLGGGFWLFALNHSLHALQIVGGN